MAKEAVVRYRSTARPTIPTVLQPRAPRQQNLPFPISLRNLPIGSKWRAVVCIYLKYSIKNRTTVMYCSTPASDGQDTGMVITPTKSWSKYGRFFLSKPRFDFNYILIFPDRWAIRSHPAGCWSTGRLQISADFPLGPCSSKPQRELSRPGCGAGQSFHQPACAVCYLSNNSIKHLPIYL